MQYLPEISLNQKIIRIRDSIMLKCESRLLAAKKLQYVVAASDAWQTRLEHVKAAVAN